MTKVFEQGEEIIFTATFYLDKAKTQPVDPSIVNLEIQKPNGDIVLGNVFEDGDRPENIGDFIVSYVVDSYGLYDWRWVTQNPIFVRQGTIKVNPNLVV